MARFGPPRCAGDQFPELPEIWGPVCAPLRQSAPLALNRDLPADARRAQAVVGAG
jgi:hypothetical protein